MRVTRPPRPAGSSQVDHSALSPVLSAVRTDGIDGIAPMRRALDEYLAAISDVEPDSLTRDEALAFWMNAYNAAALALVDDARERGLTSVLQLPAAFAGPALDVGGERLSLDAIEHGKVRRFGDPRIHAALVCGSLSCPTLRFEPFVGDGIDGQLDDQMRTFLATGGAQLHGSKLRLSRVFMWYSGDFTRRMPAWIPGRRRALLAALRRWLPPETADATSVEFMTYDWGLGCVVR